MIVGPVMYVFLEVEARRHFAVAQAPPELGQPMETNDGTQGTRDHFWRSTFNDTSSKHQHSSVLFNYSSIHELIYSVVSCSSINTS